MSALVTRPARRWLIGVLLLVAVVASACSGAMTESDSATASYDESAESASAPSGGAGGVSYDEYGDTAAEDGYVDELVAYEADVADTSAESDSAADSSDSAQPVAPADTPTVDRTQTQSSERIIKTGTVVVEVPEGSFDATVNRLTARARALGGDLTESSSTLNGAGLTSGSITLRVPVDRYEDLLASVSDVGEIISRNITSENVTAEYTDLESRLRNLRTQETFYVGLLEDAKTVSESIRVSNELARITGQIEQITGRRNVLADLSSRSTLVVDVLENGAAEVEPVNEGFNWAERLTDAFTDGIDGLVTVLAGLITLSLGLLPIALPVGLVAWFVIRRVRRRGGAGREAEPQYPAPPTPAFTPDTSVEEASQANPKPSSDDTITKDGVSDSSS